MTLPKGYKHTEIGILPNDWEVVKLGEVCELKRGKSITKKQIKKGNIPVIAGGREPAYYHNEANRAGQTIAVAGSGAYAGYISFWDSPIFVSDAFSVVPADTKKAFIKFIFYYLQNIQNDIYKTQKGTGTPHVYPNSIKNFQIPLPPLAEQEKIAEILSTWDSQIQNIESLIAEKQNLKKSLLHQLINQIIRFKGFNNDWEMIRIGDVFKITRGKVLATKKISLSQTNNNIYPVFSSKTKERGLLGFYSEYLFENCITWTTDGANAGEVNFREGKFYCTNVCGVLINTEGYNNLCVAETLNAVTKKYVSYVGNPKLMNNVVENIIIPLPSLAEQEKIAGILSALDSKIDLLKSKLNALKTQKQGLMQILLTGKARVKI